MDFQDFPDGLARVGGCAGECVDRTAVDITVRIVEMTLVLEILLLMLRCVDSLFSVLDRTLVRCDCPAFFVRRFHTHTPRARSALRAARRARSSRRDGHIYTRVSFIFCAPVCHDLEDSAVAVPENSTVYTSVSKATPTDPAHSGCSRRRDHKPVSGPSRPRRQRFEPSPRRARKTRRWQPRRLHSCSRTPTHHLRPAHGCPPALWAHFE